MAANQDPQNTSLMQKSQAGVSVEKQKQTSSWVKYLLGLVGLVYILNPTSGLFELVPDMVPFVGNLDDGAAAVLLWTGAREFLAQRRICGQASKEKSA